jgi:hypothetical protein
MRLQYNELVKFLADSNPKKFNLGDIWLRLRHSLIYTSENGERVYRISSFNDALREHEKSSNVGVAEGDFLQVCTHFGLININILSPDDLSLLTSRFRLYAAGLDNIDIDKFMSWLNPVDVNRTVRRLHKAINAYCTKLTPSIAMIVCIDDIIFKLSSESEKTNSSIHHQKILEVLHEYEVSLSTSELIALSNHFKHKKGIKMILLTIYPKIYAMQVMKL